MSLWRRDRWPGSHLGGGGDAFIKTFIFLDLLILLKLRRWSDDFLCPFDFLLATGQTWTHIYWHQNMSRHQPRDQGWFSEIRRGAWHFKEFSHPHLTHWYQVLQECWWVSRLSLGLASWEKGNVCGIVDTFVCVTLSSTGSVEPALCCLYWTPAQFGLVEVQSFTSQGSIKLLNKSCNLRRLKQPTHPYQNRGRNFWKPSSSMMIICADITVITQNPPSQLGITCQITFCKIYLVMSWQFYTNCDCCSCRYWISHETRKTKATWNTTFNKK